MAFMLSVASKLYTLSAVMLNVVVLSVVMLSVVAPFSHALLLSHRGSPKVMLFVNFFYILILYLTIQNI